MKLFQKKIGAVILKEESDVQQSITRLKELSGRADGEIKKKIEEEIKKLLQGENGEKRIIFELKNSGMDMYVLRDIYLEIGELSAQIDFIVITRKLIYVIECKNLYGNIEVDSGGNFIRIGDYGKKEGFDSPITQLRRHLMVIEKVRGNSKGNPLIKYIFEKNFENNYKPIVVFANSKTYLNMRYAKKEIKNQVIRADQLIEYIKKMDASTKEADRTEKEMLALANFFLDKNKLKKSDYVKKYEEMVETMEIPAEKEQNLDNNQNVEKKQLYNEAEEKHREEVIKKLKEFRLEQSRQEKIKPYYIFNDLQMNDLIEKSPKTKDELLKVNGFGHVKVEKYGDSILELLK